MSRAGICLLKHMGKGSPLSAYRADMAGDVAERVAAGEDLDAAWLAVASDKLAELSAEQVRIEQVVADAYAKAPKAAGKPVAVQEAPPQSTRKAAEPAIQAVDEQVAAVRALLGPQDDAEQVDATHKDPGQPAEPVTQEVVAQAISKAAKREEIPRSQMKAEALRLIDAAIASAPTQREADKGNPAPKKTTINVPGDGVFTVVNTVEKLKEFRRQVELSPGFRDKLPTFPIGKASSSPSYGPDQLAREMLEDGEPVNALAVLESAGKTMMFGNGNGKPIPYTNAEQVEIEGIAGLFVGRGFGTKKGSTSWWSVVHMGSGFAIGGSHTSKADAIAEAKKALAQPEKLEKMRSLIAQGKSADGMPFIPQEELRAQFLASAEATQEATFNANDASIARAADLKRREAGRDAFYASVMGPEAKRPGWSPQHQWGQENVSAFLKAAEKSGKVTEALAFIRDVLPESNQFLNDTVDKWAKAHERRTKPDDTGWQTGFQAPGGYRRIRRDVKDIDGTTYRAELDEFAGAYVTGTIQQWSDGDGRPRTVARYSNDRDARYKAEKFLDSVVEKRKPTSAAPAAEPATVKESLTPATPGKLDNFGEVRFSRQPGAGISMKDAEAVAATVRAMFPKAPPIFLHEDTTQVRADVRKVIQDAGAENDAEAMFHRGEIHVFINNLKDVERALFVIGRHEIRHAGLAAMFPTAQLKNQALLGIALKNRDLMDEAKRRVATGQQADRATAIEEALADMPVERLLGLTGIDRLIARVRQWLRDAAAALRKKGYATLANAVDPKEWTDTDVAAFVLKAENVSRGGGGMQPASGGTMFSDAPNTTPWYSALGRAVKTASMNAGPASAWKAMLKNWTTTGKAKADEVSWSGLDDWLDLQQGKVTKQAVQQFLDANGVRVQETVLSEAQARALPPGWTVRPWFDNESDDAGYQVLDENGEQQSTGDTQAEAIENAQDGDAMGDTPGAPKYANYTLPGGTNYREVLLTLPDSKQSPPHPDAVPGRDERMQRTIRLQDQLAQLRRPRRVDDGETMAQYEARFYGPEAKALEVEVEKLRAENRREYNEAERAYQEWLDGANGRTYRSAHWGEPNVLAHIRVNDRTDADGKRVLFVEEIQSDWGQAAKKEGIAPAQRIPTKAEQKEGYWEVTDQRGRFLTNVSNFDIERSTAEQALAEAERRLQGGSAYSVARPGVPDAPFIGKTDAWVSLALKRVIKMAVDEGYDRVAFVTGEQSAERYNLANHVGRVVWSEESGNFMAYGPDLSERVIDRKLVKPGDLEALIGKDAAKQLAETEPGPSGYRMLDTKDLKVGGEGMKAFYDKIVPAVAKDVLRKMGGQLGSVELSTGGKDWTVQFADGGRGEPMTERQAREKEADEAGDPDGAKAVKVGALTQPGFDITDAMKAHAASGMPMFSRAPSTMPTEREFYRQYAQHIDIRGRESRAAEATRAAVLSGGFKKGANVNALPPSRGGKPLNVMERDFAPLAGDVVYLAPRGAWASKTNGMEIQNGWKPEPWEVITITAADVGEPMYELFRREWEKHHQAPMFSRAQRDQQERTAEKTTKAENKALGQALTGLKNIRNVRLHAGYVLNDWMGKSAGTMSFWHKTVGTPYNVALRQPQFKPVFDAIQNFLNDVSHYAAESANLAPTILPKLETLGDVLPEVKVFGKTIGKSAVDPADAKAAAAPIFEGTLDWGRDEDGKPVRITELEQRAEAMSAEDKATIMLQRRTLDARVLRMWRGLPLDQFEATVNGRYRNEHLKPGVVWSTSELRSMFKLTEPQIALYREFRAATDKSLDDLTLSSMIRVAGKEAEDLREQALGMDMNDAAELLRDRMFDLAEQMPDEADKYNKAGNAIIDIADRSQDLKDRGYAPLSRFGGLTLDVVSPEGERLYFGMFETDRERKRKARELEAQYPEATQTQGTVSKREWELFAGVTPETLELFADKLGISQELEKTDLYQNWLRFAKADRSGLKRLIHRKGVPGFSQDIGRVLASFVYSTARQTSMNLHAGTAEDAIEAIDRTQGQLKDYAVALNQYVKNPQEEAQALRGILFAQYLGGSLASALVNATQPFMVTFPYLSQYGGVIKAEKQMALALKDVGRNVFPKDPGLTKALREAAEDGVVAPQEVFFLQAQASGKGQLSISDGTAAGWVGAKTSNGFSRLSNAWGKPFAFAELFNRRLTFIAAYRTAVEQGMPDPAKFARDAVVETQFSYNKGNRPQWARGGVGSVLFTFKTYAISMVEHMTRNMRTPQGRKAALAMLVMLVLMAGLDGLPFMEDIEDVIDGFAQRVLDKNFSLKSERNAAIARALMSAFGDKAGAHVAEFLSKGISGLPGAPIDVSGRLGLHNLIPGTGLFLKKDNYTRDVGEIAGAGGSFVARSFEALGQALAGDPLKAVVTASPTAVQNVAKAIEMKRTGYYPDTKNNMVVKTDGYDALSKGLGFQPNVVKRTQEVTYEQSKLVALAKLTEREIVDAIALGLAKGDEAAQKAGYARQESWNLKNPETPIKITPKQVIDRKNKMLTEKTARMLKATPRELRPGVSDAFRKNREADEVTP